LNIRQINLIWSYSVKNDSTFVRLENASDERFTCYWEGKPFIARAGDTIAAALLAAGVTATRETIVSGAPRAPFCMMGTCFECRVTVNGEPNVQGCMRLAEAGMQIERQRN
jgi:hypothetical protein